MDFASPFLDKELHELVKVYGQKALQYGIKIEFQSQEPLPVIEADPRRLERVFTNFLDNALKFSKENGTVIVETKEADQHIMVRIIDQGAGIDVEDLPQIFHPFHGGRGVEKSVGHGVGLAAVKAIVEAHGGRVLVKSELGKGSVFAVVLPKVGKPQQ